MAIISLTKGQVTIVDDELFEELNQWSWYAHIPSEGKFYAARGQRLNRKNKIIYLHRMVLEIKVGRKLGRGEEVDHVNRETLDNRQGNLRLCTRSQNNFNRAPPPGMTSRFKGVSWDNWSCKWSAAITVHNKSRRLGRFTCEEEAARAYDEAARLFGGEFAYLNFPD